MKTSQLLKFISSSLRFWSCYRKLRSLRFNCHLFCNYNHFPDIILKHRISNSYRQRTWWEGNRRCFEFMMKNIFNYNIFNYHQRLTSADKKKQETVCHEYKAECRHLVADPWNLTDHFSRDNEAFFNILFIVNRACSRSIKMDNDIKMNKDTWWQMQVVTLINDFCIDCDEGGGPPTSHPLHLLPRQLANQSTHTQLWFIIQTTAF